MEGLSFEERLAAARKEAKAARDVQPGETALVNQWREVSKPRKGGAMPLQPAGCKVDFPELFDRWLADRGLSDALELSDTVRGWSIYRYRRKQVVEHQPDWEAAFHGTWWYAVWLMLHTGIFLESDDRDLGHDFWEPGVYCSPNLDTGVWYARPQILFQDGVYHRVIFEVRVDPKRRKKDRKRGGQQWVFPCAAVSLYAVWVRSNVPPANGEERVNSWQPELEAIPPGWSRPLAIANPRKEPWPAMKDPFPWDFDGESDVPPWMRSGKPKDKAKTQVPSTYGKHRLGGLYGHWIQEVQQMQALSLSPIPTASNGCSPGAPALQVQGSAAGGQGAQPRGSIARAQVQPEPSLSSQLLQQSESGSIFSALLSTVNGPESSNSTSDDAQTSPPPSTISPAHVPRVVKPPSQTARASPDGASQPQWQQQQWRPKKGKADKKCKWCEKGECWTHTGNQKDGQRSDDKQNFTHESKSNGHGTPWPTEDGLTLPENCVERIAEIAAFLKENGYGDWDGASAGGGSGPPAKRARG
jgi:hypothetical protein